jgi:hemolysin activation/secretion protein
VTLCTTRLMRSWLIAPLMAPVMAAGLCGAAHAQLATQTLQDNRLDARPVLPGEDSRTEAQGAGLPAINARGNISAVHVEGSSLSAERIGAATKPFVGGAIDTGRLRALADAIAAEYKRSRIAVYSVLIPEQDFKDGEVRVVALETHVEEIVLTGPGASKAGLTQAYAATMSKERPLTRPTLERYLLLMNDIPGVAASPQLAPGTRNDAVKLLIGRQQDPVEAVVTADSRGAERLGRTQLRGDVYFNGLGYESSQTRLTAAASSDFESFLSAGLAHSGTFTSHAITATASLGWFRTRPQDGGLAGEGYTAGLQLSYPVIRSSHADLFLAAGLDGVDSKNALVGQTISNDRSRAVRAAVSGSARRGGTAASFGASVSQGLDSLGAKTASPQLATLDFVKGNLHASITRMLGDKWRIEGSATGQISQDTLPAAEMLSLGGASFGRAFETGAVSGDSGIAGMLQLTRTFDKNSWVKGSEAYAFIDGGKLWLEDRPGLTVTDYDIGSAGAGLRFGVFDNASLSLELAQAIDVADESTDEHAWRGSITLGAAF